MDLKDIIIGAVIQLGAKSVSHIAAVILENQGEDIRANPWWSEPFGPGIPPVDDFVLDLALPGSLLGVGTVTNNEQITAMGVGSGLTGIAIFTHDLIHRQATLLPPPEAAVALPRGRYGAQKMIPGVLMPKFQYGDGNPISLQRKAELAGGIYPAGYVPTRPGETATVRARQAIAVGPYAGGIGAPKFIPGPLTPKYQLGS